MKRSLLLLTALATFTMARAQCPDSTVVVYFSDFENGPGGLVASGYPDWEHGLIGNWVGAQCSGTIFNPPPGAASGQRGWGTLLNDCYNNSGDTSVVGLTVDLSDPLFTSASLNYQSHFDVFTNFDFIFIRVNGTQVYLNNSTIYSQGWIPQTVDLTPFLGNAVVNITFHMYATTVVNRAGWYIDDVGVIACRPGLSTSVADQDGAPHTAVWPNPANGQLNVRPAASGGEVREWRLLDSHGREVRRGGMLPAGAVSVLGLEGLRGLYILELTGPEGAWRERVVLH